ncbi:MAG: peptidase [Clostridia bacterium]|nr:peptidase [Clostridia bacterium]
MKIKKIFAAALVLSMLTNIRVFAEDNSITRGETAQMLLTAADDYNSGIKLTDIIQGYEDGGLYEGKTVTRAEALVMLKRAFGELPEPTGHNKRVAILTEEFTDIPEWAETELSEVFNAGIAAGTGEGVFSPDELVTKRQMELFIERVYSLFGTNERDDFYAAVNKDALNSLEIKPGRTAAGTLYDLSDESDEKVGEIIKEIISKPHEKGTKEQKIADVYNNFLDMEARNKAGITPIKKYLDLISQAQTTEDLLNAQSVVLDEISSLLYMGFNLTIDYKDSTKYMLYFGTIAPDMSKDFYKDGTEAQKTSYLKYIKTLFTLSGESDKDAGNMAVQCYEFEKMLADKMMNPEDYSNVDKMYNLFTMDEIKEMFPNVNMDKVFEESKLKKEDKIAVADVGLVKEFARLFNDDNIDSLKAYGKCLLLKAYKGAFNREFSDAVNTFNQEFMGVEGNYTDEELAAGQVQSMMREYIGEMYAERYFSEKAKEDVEKMVQDIISVYRERLSNNDWMSEETKEKAINKLNNIKVKIGYPDTWKTELDEVEIRSVKEGGSYFENIINKAKVSRQKMIELQGTEVDKTEWIMYPFTVNACYSPTSNDITFPAAILQPPMYDVNASYEQNLGGIGYIIAHEITHAFDNNGAKFDENGNATDWWTKEDYTAFQNLCDKMVKFYDGQEAVAGIPMNGTLTLSENVADQGALACITEIASNLKNPDYKTLYRSMAECWASTMSREMSQYFASVDVHCADKIRVNRVVVNQDEFYDAFGITETDGMYVKPEDRVVIW